MEWKASELDIRCSNACTRAGLTALLFSALAISMLQPLTKQKTFEALGKYIGSRLALQYALDELDADPCWQSLNRSESGASKWTISRLTEYQCTSKTKEPETKPEPAAPPPNPKVPAPPAGLRVSFPIEQAAMIANLLTALGDGDLLSLARFASNHFNYSIYR